MAPAVTLLSLSPDLLVRIIALLPSVEDIGRLDCVCWSLHRGYVPPPPPPMELPPIEEALRLRAHAGGQPVPSSLPEGEVSWTQKLCWDERRRRFGERSVVAGGMYHSVFIEGDGGVLSCGNATLDGGRPGLLGHGELVERLEVPTPIPALLGVGIRTVACAEYHTIAVSEGGIAFSWGYGGLGRLGHGDEENQMSPKEMKRPFEALAAVSGANGGGGQHHHNHHNQQQPQQQPHQPHQPHGHGVGALAEMMGGIAALSLAAAPRSPVAEGRGGGGRGGEERDRLGGRVVGCAAANCHTLLLSSDGVACAFGYAGGGRLGLGPSLDDARQVSPLVVDSLRRLGVTLKAVAAGTYHSLLLATDGTLYSCGEGGLGQLGHGWAGEEAEGDRGGGGRSAEASGGGGGGGGSSANEFWPRPIEGLRRRGVRVSAIAAGRVHSVCVTDEGAVYSFGDGLDGRLGHGDSAPCAHPRLLSGAFGGQRVIAVSCVWDHTIALTDGGGVYSWGLGLSGQLGHGDSEEDETVDRPKRIEGRLRETLVSAVAAGARHCFAVASDGRLFGWGQARTTESEKVDTLGLRLDANQCRPLMYDGLRISRPHLARG